MTAIDLTLPVLAALAAEPTPVDLETIRLLTLARHGDCEAFGQLLAPHLLAARRVALAAVGRHEEADEAVQEASLAAWLRLESLAVDAAFRSWFLRIVWRKALDRRRSIRTWMARFVSGHDTSAVAVEPASPDEGPEDAAIATDLERAAARVVCALPRRLRDPFLLAASGDHRYEEIAALLGLPVGSVKWRVSEARRMIRLKLERLGLTEEGS